MGSFNTSCMVSQQVIIPGMEAFILPIQQQATYSPVELVKGGIETSQYGFAHTSCYPTAFWGYSGPIIRGKYEDYGLFKLIETDDNSNNLVSFFDHLIADSYNTKQGENEYHDHAFDIHSIYNPKQNYSFAELETIWDSLWEVSQENRLFVCDYNNQPRNLQFAVIHHAAADYLINTVNSFKNYEGKSYEQKSYFDSYIRNKLEKAVHIFSNKEKHIDSFYFFTSQLTELYDYRIGEQEGSYISNYYINENNVIDLIEDFVSKNPGNNNFSTELIDKLFEHFKTQIQHRYLHVGLNNLNIKLSPMIYASQDYDNTAGKAYAKMIRTVSAQVVKETKEND